MTDFSIFENIVTSYNETECNKPTGETGICLHVNSVFENGITTCTCCGEEVDRPLVFSKDWRYYNSSDSKRSDPTRVHARKIEEKNISKDVSSMNFSDSIVSVANDLYIACTKGQIYRGGSRKAVIFACIFHAYKLAGNHQTPDALISAFGLTRKAGLKGMKILNINIPKESEIHNTIITPNHIISDTMDKFLTTPEQKNEVYEIYKKIDNRSSKLNRARPQSVAAAVIYHWVNTRDINISISDFAGITNLSELTILKNMKEVERVLSELG
jgi:transcription initiation factor TFIIIB Brf1 subunit/transcription initiation factor TFIIB